MVIICKIVKLIKYNYNMGNMIQMLNLRSHLLDNQTVTQSKACQLRTYSNGSIKGEEKKSHSIHTHTHTRYTPVATCEVTNVS